MHTAHSRRLGTGTGAAKDAIAHVRGEDVAIEFLATLSRKRFTSAFRGSFDHSLCKSSHPFNGDFHTEKLERCVFSGEGNASRKRQRPCWRATLGPTAFSSRNSMVSRSRSSSPSLSQIIIIMFIYSHIELKEKVNLLLQINEKLALQLNE